MNKPAAFCLLAFVLAANCGCEQQSYEETKMFNQSSHATSHGHGDTHAAGSGGEHKPEKH